MAIRDKRNSGKKGLHRDTIAKITQFSPADEMKNRRQTLEQKLRKKGWIKSIKTLTRFVTDRAMEIDLAEVSSSMALATLLAIVPVLALSVAVFTAFPSFADARQSLEELILGSFLPEQYSNQLVGYLRDLARHAAGLTTFGIAGLAATTLLLIDKLFITVNRIFKVRRMRPWSQRAMIYWALITIGPLAVGLSLTMTGKLASMALEGVNSGVSSLLYNLGQIALQWLSFAMIYKFVPNCRVNVSHALVGGFLVVVIGQIVKQGFEYYVTTGTLSSVYGAFVALPVLILWIYVAWFLFFAGAAITATIPKLTAGRFMDSYREGNDFLTGLVMLKELVQLRLAEQSPIMNLDELSDCADTHPEAASRILSQLAVAGYVAPVTDETRPRALNWVLVADTQKMGLLKAFEAFSVNGGNSLVSNRSRDIDNPDTAAGELAQWWAMMSESEALTTPMAQLWPLEEARAQESSEDAPDKTSESTQANQ